jgi:hypothetical protein
MHVQLHARRRGGVCNHQLPRTIMARQPSKWMKLHETYFVLTQTIMNLCLYVYNIPKSYCEPKWMQTQAVSSQKKKSAWYNP